MDQYQIDFLQRRLTDAVNHILYGAFRRYRFGNRPLTPVVALVPGMREWGRYVYDPVSCVHRIELREELLLNHPWYAVEDVLRHELAHFLKQFYYPNVEERPHGKKFCLMCAKIGANPAASGDYPLLDDALNQDDVSTDGDSSPMAQKIRKLLALSESPNENEAHLALMKARELMAKYQVTETDGENNDADPFVTVEIKLPEMRISDQSYALAALLNDFYDVRCLGTTVFSLVNPAFGIPYEQQAIAVSGRRSKVKIALYVWNYISRFLDEAWGTVPWKLLRNGGVRERRDYQLGCIRGIREVLKKQNSEGNVAGLVLANAELDAYHHAHFPSIVHVRSSKKRNERLLDAGAEAGRKLEIRTGIENTGEAAQKRLKS